MPHHTPQASEVTRRAVVAGTGVLAVSAALAACSSYGSSAQPGPQAPVESAPLEPVPLEPAPLESVAPPAPDGPPAGPAGESLASTADIPVGGGEVFADQNVVVTQPQAGTFKAFSAVCTHQGCTVSQVAAGTINCPCHGSKFAIADGSVVDGPASSPLEERRVTVSGDAIQLA
ncbi:MAG: Rieske (2Fe-2S) protein [Actinomycetota bacterium]|nr:Rieske (2Fe-2S) protein [Actinomycetota bacterium]